MLFFNFLNRAIFNEQQLAVKCFVCVFVLSVTLLIKVKKIHVQIHILTTTTWYV